MGGHPGAHVQELGERACVAVQPGGRPGRGPKGRPRLVRAGGEPAEQEVARVEPRTARQPAPDAGERVQGSDRHIRRRRQTGQYRRVPTLHYNNILVTAKVYTLSSGDGQIESKSFFKKCELGK